MNLDFRKCRILASVVESYIDTGEPVGSKALVEMLGNSVSSATIRNDMAALTAAGYLHQPHTSAGRLPTPKALRFYVEQLMDRRDLTLQERVDINNALSDLSGDATRLLEDACRILADSTGLAAVACRPRAVGVCISRVDVMQVSPRNMAVILIQDNGFVHTRMCRCQRDIPTKVTLALTEYLSHRFVGRSIETVTVPAMQEVMWELGEAGLAVAPILSAFYELALECVRSRVAVAGQLNLLRHPDLPLERGRALVHFLSERQNVADLLEPAVPPGGVRVLVGEEGTALAGAGLIVARYPLGKRGQGAIALVGPARLNYAAAIPRMDYFAAAVGRMMSDLFEDTKALDF